VAKSKARVAILMGSDSDLPVMGRCLDTLKVLGVPFEVRVLSAHRTPDHVEEYVARAEGDGVEVFVCAAGGAAHLAGAVVARTLRPVIGVPLDATPLGGLDALLSTVQMPSGVPVATVAVGEMGASNAGFLAARILALSDPALRARLEEHREGMVKGVLEKDAKVRGKSTG
jgi:phosphoribosylaminoimidazole carboxylase PurE protein